MRRNRCFETASVWTDDDNIRLYMAVVTLMLVVASTGGHCNLLRHARTTVSPECIHDTNILMKAIKLYGWNISKQSGSIDTDKIIMCVQKKPELWDKSTKQYGEKNSREKACINVGGSFYQVCEQLHVNEREEKDKILFSYIYIFLFLVNFLN